MGTRHYVSFIPVLVFDLFSYFLLETLEIGLTAEMAVLRSH